MCTLTNTKPDKAFPSLVKCYKNNKSSCCNAGQDAYIKDKMEAFFPDSCQRSFDEITRYFCFGCTSKEPKAVRTITTNATSTKPATSRKAIIMCKSYIEELWGGVLTKPTTRFDNCGMTLPDGSGSKVILPSLQFQNVSQFLSAVKPPLYDDYEILVIDDKDYMDCYGNRAI